VGENFNVISYKWISYGAGPIFRARASWVAGSDPSMCSSSRLTPRSM